MRAVRYDRFGPPDVLRVEDIPEPQPAAGEVKIRVRAASVNPLDGKIRHGHLRMVPLLERPPRGVGSDFAGEIVAVGGGPTSHFVGQSVFGSLPPFKRPGAFAEYVVAATSDIATMPETLTFTAAAALPVAGGTALQALEDHAHVVAGQRVLITGAAGGVGHFAVQLAKHRGARVTAVCGPSNIEFVRALGADDVIDYTREDFTRRDGHYDVVFDVAAVSTYFACRPLLTPEGIYLNTIGNPAAVANTMLGAVFARVTSGQRAIAIMLRAGAPLWIRVATLAGSGALKPHVERTIGLDEVADAQRSMETGHGRGKIIVVPLPTGEG